MTLDARLAGLLVCPRDGSDLTEETDDLVCAEGHRYPCPGGIPVLLRDDVWQTHAIMERSMREAREPVPSEEEYSGEGIDALYVVADARHLPFKPGSFKVAFSYSVFQHLREQDVQESIDEIARVLEPGGRSRVQMPNVFGARNLYLQVRERRLREPVRQFDVRYWFPRELRRSFGRIGPTALEVDGFFSLNAQSSDLALMPWRFRAAIRLSDLLRSLARRFPPLTLVADSLYVRSTRA